MPKKKTTPVPVPATPKLTIALPPLVEPEAEADLDTPAEQLSSATRSLLAGPSRAKNKPDISRLPDAVAGGRPLFKTGDKIVIERYASMFTDRPYIDTRTWHVNEVDLDTGRVKLFDEALMQHGTDNWKSGNVYKFASGAAVTTKRKRGRPRKNPVEAVPVVTVVTPGEKKRRGRPKGSKNRPKEVIAEERVAKRAEKLAKRARRGR